MLVLDANILIRGVLGRRVRELLAVHSAVRLLVPDSAVAEAREHLPLVLAARGLDPLPALVLLDQIVLLLDVIDAADYSEAEAIARERLMNRDPEDWPVAAVALTFGCPIWTEDADFFGCGIATWTTDRVAIYLRSLTTADPAGPIEAKFAADE